MFIQKYKLAPLPTLALILVLCLGILLSALCLQAGAIPVFSDVNAAAWYAPYIDKLLGYEWGIISGYEDGTFRPDQEVTRGEFLKMIFEACAIQGNSTMRSSTDRDAIHWAGKYYTMAVDNNVLIADAYESNDDGGTTQLFPCTVESLNTPISRYEMAVILNNVCTNVAMETTLDVKDLADNIADYWEISRTVFTNAVAQTYGRGLVQGDETGAYHGENTLRRCEAVKVIYLFLWSNERQMPSWASTPVATTIQLTAASTGQDANPDASPDANANPDASTSPDTSPDSNQDINIGTGMISTPQTVVNSNNNGTGMDPSTSFAFWLQPHLSGSTPDATAKARIFGSEYKSYFTSSSDAAPYMEDVTIPIWKLDNSGAKIPGSMTVTVNRLVAEEILSIFTEIYNDPEQFPIYGGWSVGGARFTDHLRHSWGMAIDVNAYYNCECNFKSGYQRVTCGYGWWPEGLDDSAIWIGRTTGSYHGSMSGASPYSIAPGSSVVRAFAKYGWGWGGNGWSGGKSFDFMHFSVLPSGG